MEENKVMETVVNEVSEATTEIVVPAEVTDVAVPDDVITEVPVIDESTGKLDVVHVALGGAAILGVGYLLIKGSKWAIKKFGPKFKKPEKKYARVTDEVTEEYEMFEDEDIDSIPAEEDSTKTEEK